jgi:naphthoate synthase
MAHDLLLRGYLETEEHDEMAASFAEHRKPDASKFGQ